jgi:MFS family permease
MKAKQLRFVAAVIATLSLITLDSSALPIAQAGIGRSLRASAATLQWALIANCLTWAVLTPVGCGLRCRYGDRRVFAAGELLLAAACAVAAVAPNGLCLVAGRVGQGAAAALIVPTALAHLGDTLSPRMRGALPSPAGGGAELSAVFGALACAGVVQSLGWRWIFWLNIPFCLAAFALAQTQPWAEFTPRRNLDPLGALVFAAGSFGLLWALMNVDRGDWDSLPLMADLVVATALLGYHVSGRMPLGSFRIRELTGFRAAYACGCATLFGSVLVLVTRLTLAGESPAGAWVRLVPLYLGFTVCAPISTALARRSGQGRLAAAAFATAAAGLGLLAAGIGAGAPYPLLIVPFLLTGGGIVLALPTTRRLAVGPRLLTPGQEVASSGSLRLFAAAVGIAIAYAAADGRAFEPVHQGSAGDGPDGSVAALIALAAVCATGSAAAFIASYRPGGNAHATIAARA